MENGQKKRANRVGRALLASAILLLAAAVCGVSAKYVQERTQEMVVQAQLFYFTGDLLTEEGETYPVNAETQTIRIKLRNYVDELRVSDCEIQYEIFVNGVKQGGTNAMIPTESEKKVQAEVEIPVQPGNTYLVEVTANAGYSKTLRATFVVDEKPEGFYKELDTGNDYFVLLTVWTEQVSGDVTVAFPAGLIPDDTDPAMAAVENYADGAFGAGVTGKMELGEYASHTYRFFKENTAASFAVGQFTVTMDRGAQKNPLTAVEPPAA